MDYNTSQLIRRGLPVALTLCVFLLILVTAATLHLGREVFVPIALAILLSFLLAPGVRLLQRAKFPHGLAVVSTVLIAFAVLGLVGTIVAGQLSQLTTDLPRYRETVRTKIEALGQSGNGQLGRVIGIYHDLAGELKAASGAGGEASASLDGRDGRPVPVTIQSTNPFETLGGFVSPLLHPLATGVLVLIIAIFILAQREDLRNRFIRLVGTDDLQHTTAVIDDAGRRLSRLFLMQLAVNAAFGTAIGLGLWAIGLPSPLLWGVLAGILRFIPYIGAIIGALLPLALAVAVDPGWTMVAWTAFLFVTVEPLVGHVLEPLLYGHSTGISPVAVILSATVWTFLWGPIGLVLATPLTVCLVVLGRHVGRLEFLDIMLGDRPVLSPPQMFYQRMLAGDPSEAVLQAREFLRERALATYYDEVALEGLRLAHEDIARGRVTPDRVAVLRRSTLELVRALDGVRDPTPKRGGPIGAEAAAAIDAAGPDRESAMTVLRPQDLAPGWSGETPVACAGAPGTLDEVVARMLAQVLTKHGVGARYLNPAEIDASGEPDGVRLVCLSYVEPLSTLHLRHAVRVARRRSEGALVALGIWRQRDPGGIQSLRHAARADLVATTIHGALAGVLASARAAEPLARAAPVRQHAGAAAISTVPA